ncbi:MAG: nucleoid-associated protein [Lachnospiraceae bacterium]|nr:nucleoid-associated protein [Lachnospiraceae bacterium]
MVKEEIRIIQMIVHILDATVGMPVLSDSLLEYGSDFGDFVREHIGRLAGGDEAKDCEFYQKESEIYQLIREGIGDNFIPISHEIATQLYAIMNSNIDIPSADLLVVHFTCGQGEYLALLKMNFKSGYTHRTLAKDEGNVNDIISYKAVLPTQSQRLTEAAIIDLHSLKLKVVEKKYEVNGEKTNYFSYLFLKCSSQLSHKAKLNIVTKAIDKVQKEGLGEWQTCEAAMTAKAIIQEELAEKGGFVVEELADRVFEEQADLRNAFQEQMEKYDMVREEVVPQSDTTTRKYQKQHLLTDTGIEIKIPMEQYRDSGSIEFITNEDGTISLLIKNIEHLEAKY